MSFCGQYSFAIAHLFITPVQPCADRANRFQAQNTGQILALNFILISTLPKICSPITGHIKFRRTAMRLFSPLCEENKSDSFRESEKERKMNANQNIDLNRNTPVSIQPHCMHIMFNILIALRFRGFLCTAIHFFSSNNFFSAKSFIRIKKNRLLYSMTMPSEKRLQIATQILSTFYTC